MVYCHEDANDILQNSFLKAWSHLDLFRGDAKISTWLYRIALNETLNFIQKKKESVALDDTSASIINRLEADEYFDGDQTELQLQQAMSLLPEKQRMVFQLKYYEEMKYEQMSEILGTSIGALKASYHHAVKKIYDFFNSCD
jgi:RNA polymerase sigma-70 factor (ECF subfamily)